LSNLYFATSSLQLGQLIQSKKIIYFSSRKSIKPKTIVDIIKYKEKFFTHLTSLAFDRNKKEKISVIPGKEEYRPWRLCVSPPKITVNDTSIKKMRKIK